MNYALGTSSTSGGRFYKLLKTSSRTQSEQGGMPKVNGNGWTPIQRAILEVLSDGQVHLRDKVHKRCCGPSSVDVVRQHVKRINAKLPGGEKIATLALQSRQIGLQWVRTLASANDGRT